MAKFEPMCADCAGYDYEWMYRCEKHGLEFCRGCSCPECADEMGDDFEDDDESPCMNIAHEACDETPCPSCGKLP